ncbi:MAG TPA: dihydrolipoamide acetyltransferase family protein [Candidatus Dormibacteraeota bacterium]|nr:dihydrolipoamide acetyltransferase family protein [Candidatus Dormibacteraeota bacterium]
MGVAPIKMPQLGESVTEGTVDRWLKKEGDYVKRDEPIVEVVTDKVNAEIPSPFEGKLVKIAVPEGTTIPIGVEIAVIELAGADAGLIDAEAPPSPPEAVAAPAAAPGAEAVSAPSVRQRLSPAVRRLAEEHGLDPAQIAGSGEGGRVTRDDVLAFVARREAAPAEPAPLEAPAAAASAPQAAEPGRVAVDGAREELVRLSVMRRSIAEHMTRSLATSPHAWTLQEIDVSGLVSYREAEKEGFRQRHGTTLTYLPFVVQVVCDAIKEFPYLNSSWTDDGIVLKRYINMGIAVAIPDGLIVPVVRDADRLGFTDLAQTINDLADRARNRQLKPDEVAAGTFTLNNTGATGSIASQPIINQPQAAILTTEAIMKRPVVIADGIAVRHMMNMCLSFDHRIIDGMTAGQFLGFIKRRLESWGPASIRL